MPQVISPAATRAPFIKPPEAVISQPSSQTSQIRCSHCDGPVMALDGDLKCISCGRVLAFREVEEKPTRWDLSHNKPAIKPAPTRRHAGRPRHDGEIPCYDTSLGLVRAEKIHPCNHPPIGMVRPVPRGQVGYASFGSYICHHPRLQGGLLWAEVIDQARADAIRKRNREKPKEWAATLNPFRLQPPRKRSRPKRKGLAFMRLVACFDKQTLIGRVPFLRGELGRFSLGYYISREREGVCWADLVDVEEAAQYDELNKAVPAAISEVRPPCSNPHDKRTFLRCW